ncbi:MAG: FHA domain-containing protein [Deltaproteobacteria bacterium]|nr:MAG: FHA domain-containing protein [Deltaproteobacteria bacterium]
MNGSQTSQSVRPRIAPSGHLKISVEILSGPLDGLEFHFDQATVSVGRAENNDLCLGSDQLVSRRHARLGVEEGNLWVEDTQSLNGTYLNNRRLEAKTPLASGDIFRVGMSELRVRLD